jgi:glycosyltransferase involved in cell wall biosynthesis
MIKPPEISIIISTYNSPRWLEKVLWGYTVQTYTDFEIVIADDGSTEETEHLLDLFSKNTSLSIKHIWHEDQGFQKTKILNKAVLASQAEYCIFTDGDCIPRKDFIETHFENRRTSTFLSGGHFPLSMELSHIISKKDILNQDCFDLSWLSDNGLKKSFKNIKLVNSSSISNFMNLVTSTKPTWNGGNASAWKKDILAINGFDERMKYGGEDREFGERLINYGVKPKRVRYLAIVVHLEHERGYVNEVAWRINNEIREATKKERTTKTSYGINLHS